MNLLAHARNLCGMGNSFLGAAVVMGVSSCGKTSVGEALARLLGASFTEGDRLHPAANIAKMSAGTPLTDDDRWPWLGAVGQTLRGPGAKVAFVFLDGSRALLASRIAARQGHFMPPSLLDSQLQTLEPPGPEEWALRLDIAQPVPELAQAAADWLNERRDT